MLVVGLKMNEANSGKFISASLTAIYGNSVKRM